MDFLELSFPFEMRGALPGDTWWSSFCSGIRHLIKVRIGNREGAKMGQVLFRNIKREKE